jgi:phosphate transport system substrate-binding protein
MARLRPAGPRPATRLVPPAGLVATGLIVTGLIATGLAAAVPAPAPPAPTLTAQPGPLQVVGDLPPWAQGRRRTQFQALPPRDMTARLLDGRADLALSRLPLGPESTLRSVPVGVYPVAVAYNLPGVALTLDLGALCTLLAGRLPLWNSPAITSLNRGQRLPQLPVLVSVRGAPNPASLAAAGACVALGVWPSRQLKSNWTAGAAFVRATPGASRTDLNLPGVLSLFPAAEVPVGAQVARLQWQGQARAPAGGLGLSAALPLPASPWEALGLPDLPGRYPLRGLVWLTFRTDKPKPVGFDDLLAALRAAGPPGVGVGGTGRER